MTIVRLPSNPNIDRLKATAKDLRNLVRAGVDGAIETVREHHPRHGSLISGSPEALAFKLADAQLTLARHHGFSSWPKVVAHTNLVRSLARSPHDRLGDATAADSDTLVCLACLNYGDDSAERVIGAKELWRAHPELASSSIFAAAAAGNHTAVAQFVASDQEAAQRHGGPFDWPPLLYCTYSRLATDDPTHDFVETARVLLRAGADANSGFLWDGLVPPFTAITGAVGRGEQGARPHGDQLALLRLLLDTGADANDGQSVYNAGIGSAQPVDDTDWLALLLDKGLGRVSNGSWYRKFTDQLSEPTALIAELLHDAARRGFANRARVLLERGADPNRGGDHSTFRGRTPYRDAIECGHTEIAAMLVDAGASRADVSSIVELTGRCLSGAAVSKSDAATVRAHRPDLVRVAAELEKPIAVIRHLVDLGFDINAKSGTTALHEAAMRGRLDIVTMLVELGADPTVLDDNHTATAAGWAQHFGHNDVESYLANVPESSVGVRMNAKPATAEEYLATFPAEVQNTLRVLRGIIYDIIPDATEVIRYSMPAVMVDGHYVVHYAAWKRHIGLYPIPPMPADLEREVAPYRSTKDTMRLPYATPLPEALLRRVLTELVNQRATATTPKPAVKKRGAR